MHKLAAAALAALFVFEGFLPAFAETGELPPKHKPGEWIGEWVDGVVLTLPDGTTPKVWCLHTTVTGILCLLRDPWEPKQTNKR